MTDQPTSTDADQATARRVDTITKLLAKAEGTANEDEAGAFFAKAEELMTRWAIDDAMLRASGRLARETIEKRMFEWTGSSLNSTWDADMHLMFAIARTRGVQMLQARQLRRMYLIGFTSDVDACLTVFTSLVVQSARFQREAWARLDRAERQNLKEYDRRVWARSFRSGFADRIGARLRDAHAAATATARETHGSGMEVVLVDRRAQVDAFYDQLEKGTARARRSRSNPGARSAGRAAADRADMGQQRVAGRAALPQ